MSAWLKKLVVILGWVAAVPFVAYGVVGILRWLDLDGLLDTYVGLSMTSNPIRAVVYIIIGILITLGIKVLSERIR